MANNKILFRRSIGRETLEDLLLYLPDMLKCEIRYNVHLGKSNTYPGSSTLYTHLSTDSIRIVGMIYNRNLESAFFSSIRESNYPTLSVGLRFLKGSQGLWQRVAEKTKEYFSVVNTKQFHRAPYKEIRKYHK